MRVALFVAAAICLGLALGHMAVGRSWIVPHLTKEHFPATSLGPASMTAGIARFSWHVVTIVLLAFAALLSGAAVTEDDAALDLLLRWFAGFWTAATGLAVWQSRRRPRNLVRFPVALAFPVLVVLCWTASG